MKMKKMIIRKASIEEVTEQFELRMKNIRSEVNVLLARKMFETINSSRGFSSEELSEATGESCQSINKRVNTLGITHGMKIMNMSKVNHLAEYKLVAFAMPQKKKRYDKKIPKANVVMEHPLTHNLLINQVFC